MIRLRSLAVFLPGAWNALGSVVLDMPNPFDVYLHDTPGRNLFARPQRALSHGCIRVEEVRTLAALLLGVPALPPAGMETRAIPLAAPVAVYLLYQTVFIAPEGTVEFRDDIYGRGKALVAMLALPEDGRPPERTVAGLACPGMSRGLASLNP
jgi:murein L,D-transpeptidase YcbB/YkuD